MKNYEIYDDKAVRFVPVRDDFVKTEIIITKEEFLACYNTWVLGENYRPNCDGDKKSEEE